MEPDRPLGEESSVLYSPEHEAAYFGVTGGIAVLLGLLMAAVGPWTRRAMLGVL